MSILYVQFAMFHLYRQLFRTGINSNLFKNTMSFIHFRLTFRKVFNTSLVNLYHERTPAQVEMTAAASSLEVFFGKTYRVKN
jgi:hypothetical protein